MSWALGILVLGILVGFHEWGHFFVARRLGIDVEVFSIGWGPVLFSWSKQGVQYQWRILPLGGFVRLSQQSLEKAKKWIQALVFLGGPSANFFLSWLVFFSLATLGTWYWPPEIGYVLPQGAAEKAGVLPGDSILTIQGKKISTWSEMKEAIEGSKDSQELIPVTVKRSLGEEKKEISLWLDPRGQNRWGLEMGYWEPILVNPETQGLFTVSHVTWKQKSQSIKSWKQLLNTLDLAKKEGASSVKLFSSEENFSLALDGESGSHFLKKHGFRQGNLKVKEVSSNLSLFQPNDLLLKGEDTELWSLDEWQKPHLPQRVTLQRGDKILEVSVTEKDWQMITLGAQVLFPRQIWVQYGPWKSLQMATKEVIHGFKMTFQTILALFKKASSWEHIQGPLGIMNLAKEAADIGLGPFLKILAMMSLSLGIFNLFPIPPLDGGKILELGLWSLFPHWKNNGTFLLTFLGVFFLLGLMLFGMYNDLQSLLGGL